MGALDFGKWTDYYFRASLLLPRPWGGVAVKKPLESSGDARRDSVQMELASQMPFTGRTTKGPSMSAEWVSTMMECPCGTSRLNVHAFTMAAPGHSAFDLDDTSAGLARVKAIGYAYDDLAQVCQETDSITTKRSDAGMSS